MENGRREIGAKKQPVASPWLNPVSGRESVLRREEGGNSGDPSCYAGGEQAKCDHYNPQLLTKDARRRPAVYPKTTERHGV